MICQTVIPAVNTKDPYWDDSARDLLKAILFGMFEDSETELITEDKFSFSTVMNIFDSFTDSGDNTDTNYDKGVFLKTSY